MTTGSVTTFASLGSEDKGEYFNYAFSIEFDNGKGDIVFGTLKYDIAGGNEASNKFPNGRRKVWISLTMSALYGDDIHYLTYIEQMFEA